MMKNHIKVYLEANGYDETDWIPCQVCGETSVDIHHIIYKSQKGKDEPKNLIALCRKCHDRAHFKKSPYLHKEELQEIVNFHLRVIR